MAFNWDLLTSDWDLEEGLYLDRKQELYKLEDDDKKIDFIEDLIAFANTSRATGRQAHLIFGVTDELERNGVPGVPPDSTHQIAFWEGIKHRWHNIAEDYIDPPLILDFDHVEIDGKHFACLEFEAVSTSKPFQVRKSLRGRKKVIQPGARTLLRSGESNHRNVEMDDVTARLNYTLMPLLFPYQWINFCEWQTQLVQQDMPSDEGYQHLRFTSGEDVEAELHAFIGKQERLFVVEGVAGSGKTLAMKKTCLKLLWDFRQRIEQCHRMEVLTSLGIVPLYYSLRGVNLGVESLAARVVHNLNLSGRLWNISPGKGELVFDLPRTQWILLLA